MILNLLDSKASQIQWRRKLKGVFWTSPNEKFLGMKYLIIRPGLVVWAIDEHYTGGVAFQGLPELADHGPIGQFDPDQVFHHKRKSMNQPVIKQVLGLGTRNLPLKTGY